MAGGHRERRCYKAISRQITEWTLIFLTHSGKLMAEDAEEPGSRKGPQNRKADRGRAARSAFVAFVFGEDLALQEFAWCAPYLVLHSPKRR
jgi:hypothetical protein